MTKSSEDALSTPFLQYRLEFPFPVEQVHSGIPLSNGTLGALIWGKGRHVRLTLNRADFWDHGGGLEFGPETTYANLRGWLEERSPEAEARLRQVFEGADDPSTDIRRPTRLPMGRIDLELPPGWGIDAGGLYLHTAEAELDLSDARDQAKLRATVLRDASVLCLRVAGLDGSLIRIHNRPPDSAEVQAFFQSIGYPKPQVFDLGEVGGWMQERSGEPALCVAWLQHATSGGLVLYVTSAYGENAADARRAALQILDAARAEGYTTASLRSFALWRRWWQQAPVVRLPDHSLELLYYTGMYRLAGLSVPGGPAATLQGPWVEEHRLPPWSGDYHFNINVQQCYWPCFAGNHPEALLPLVEMLRSWLPRLQQNAQLFAGVSDGLLLPHATDDRGVAIGGFWPGLADPASVAWVAQLFWLYFRYTQDTEFLRETAYPFLRGALRVYEALLEEHGKHYALPVSVSPEFDGSSYGAWGRNASFQLAMIHFLCRTLLQASTELGIDEALRGHWEDLDARVPTGSVGPGDELLVWEGQPLTESHRHHSHLAGIYPLDVLEYHPYQQNETHRKLVHNSMRRLTAMGSGCWAGWSLPWASILQARVGLREAAVLSLETFRRLFLTPGYASTHDAREAGWTVFDYRPDVMQVEAGCGAAAAVMELLLHTAGGVLHVFPGAPARWEYAQFRGIRAEGAFVVSADLEQGAVTRMHIRSEAGMLLRLANPWKDASVVLQRGDSAPVHLRGRILELETQPGENLVITRGRG